MANVTILSLVFRPDNVSTAQLMADLGEDLVRKGHRVTVLTTTPHYNHDEVASAAQPLKPCWAGILRRSEYRGMEVFHAWMPRKGRSKIYRIVTWLAFHVTSTIAGFIKIPKPDIILSPSPPLTIGVSAWLIARFHRARFIYNVQEVYPDVAVNLGALKNPWLISRLFALERFVYRHAAAITVISSHMLGRLMAKGVDRSKLVLIPNFVDVREFAPGQKDNTFSRAHGLTDKFVISYAGNMGKPQQLEVLIEAAGLLQHHDRVRFLLMGGGSELDRLRRIAAEKGLTNVIFLSHQPYTVMPDAYAASNVCYVPQAIGTSSDGIPSKVYRIMAAGRPVLALTDAGSDLAALVEEAKAGAVVTSVKAESLANAITAILQNEYAWAGLGRNGRAHVTEVYDRTVVSDRYHRLIEATIANAAARPNSPAPIR